MRFTKRQRELISSSLYSEQDRHKMVSRKDATLLAQRTSDRNICKHFVDNSVDPNCTKCCEEHWLDYHGSLLAQF